MAYKLLFVCLGNICRSPSAENIMNHLLVEQGYDDQVRCDSAGTSSYHIGNPPDRRMTAAAQQRGIRMQGKARQFHRSDFEQFDLILAMDEENFEDILAMDREGKYRHKVRKMCDFCIRYGNQDVPDPYYGGQEGFNFVIDLLLDACQGLLDHLISSNAIQARSETV
jgi:protein-tyrosine phosphatase